MEASERGRLLDVWFRDYADRVRSYLLHRIDRETAEDLLQEVFVIAFRKAEQVPEPAIGWLFGTARRVLANRLRSTRRHDQLLDRVTDDLLQTDDTEVFVLKQAFLDTIAELPDLDREALTLTGWYGLAPAEAAQALDVTTSAFNVRVHRARRRLMTHLETGGYQANSPAGLFAEVFGD